MRIRQGRDFARLRVEGRRVTGACLIANWQVLLNAGHSRLGVITSRKVGPAVTRNRARRLLREAFRLNQHAFANPLDLVLVARAGIVGKSRQQVEQDFLRTLQKAGLLKPPQAPAGAETSAAKGNV
jgi:ribonuclease P protein component